LNDLPEPKDVIIGILGASGAFAGLLLIFSGFLFAQATAFPPATTDNAVIEKYKNAGRLGVVPFLLSLLVSTLAFAWMLYPCSYLYFPCVIGFGVLLLASAAYGTFVLIRYL
jgi:hypothetical protein